MPNTLSQTVAGLQLRWLLPLAALALIACAGPGTANPQDQLRQRVNDRWKALVAADYVKAYTFATPAYRELVSAEKYRGRQGNAVQRVGAEIFNVDCPEPVRCNVRVVISATVPLGRNGGSVIKAPLDESWLFQDGQWWVVERP